MKQELINELEKATEALKDFGKFKHLFPGDDAERKLAELGQTIGKVSLLVQANNLKELAHPKNKMIEPGFMGHKMGALVQIRPCGKEYEGKTFLGFYLGEFALGSSITIEDDTIQLNWGHHNPAIFVPEIGKIIYGCESWWQEIESEEQLKQITDKDIENVWYVQLLKAFNKGKSTSSDGAKSI